MDLSQSACTRTIVVALLKAGMIQIKCVRARLLGRMDRSELAFGMIGSSWLSSGIGKGGKGSNTTRWVSRRRTPAICAERSSTAFSAWDDLDGVVDLARHRDGDDQHGSASPAVGVSHVVSRTKPNRSSSLALCMASRMGLLQLLGELVAHALRGGQGLAGRTRDATLIHYG